jgi:hypothetical protein
MAHYGSLAGQSFGERVDDIRGATVYGSDDQKIGKVGDVIFDHATMEIVYVVVDTDDSQARKFLVPASQISADATHPEDFNASITKEESKNVPSHDDKTKRSGDKWSKYLAEFKKWWEETPILHRKDRPDRAVTPPEEPATAEPTGNTSAVSGGEGVPAAKLFPERMTDKFSDPTPGGHKVTLRRRSVARAEEAAQGVALLRPRWDDFEEFLSLNRAEIIAQCGECGQEFEGKRAPAA